MAYMVTVEKAHEGKSILESGETIQQMIVDTVDAAREIASRWHSQARDAKIGVWVTIDTIDLR